MTGNLEVLQSEIIKLRNNKEVNSLTLELLGNYKQILNYKTNFPVKNSSKLEKFVTSKRIEEKYFSESFAGENAYISYQNYLENADANNFFEAAKYYFIANYLRTKNIDFNLRNIPDVYKLALDLHDAGEYQKSLDYIEANKVDPGNNYILKNYNDDINALVDLNQKKLKALSDKELYWHSKKNLTKSWFFSIGLQSVFQPSHENIIFDFSTQTPAFVYTQGLVAKQNNFGFSINLQHTFSDRFALGVDMMKTQLSYTSEFDLNQIYYDYSFDVVSTHLKGIYYLRKYVGFRPYVAVGVGYLSATREESEVKVIINPLGPISNSYTLPEKTFSSMHSLYEVGIQFIANGNSQLFFNVKATFYKNHDEDIALKTATKSIGLDIGFLF